MAEAMALRATLYFAQEEGMDRIIVASDCLSVVQRLSARDRDRSGCGPVIEDIKRLATSFLVCSFRHVNRLHNYAAHYLPRSVQLSGRAVWRGVPPVCIRETICISIMR